MMTPTGNANSALALPNLLTLLRIAAVPALVASMLLLPPATAAITAFALFTVASITDWLDGYLARAWQMQSLFGTMLDPIADKLLVGTTLVMLVWNGTLLGLAVIPALIILGREILVSGLREFLASFDVKIPVSAAAKWKTAVQMAAIALLLLAPALPVGLATLHDAGHIMLWIAAALTLWTGGNYLLVALEKTRQETPAPKKAAPAGDEAAINQQAR